MPISDISTRDIVGTPSRYDLVLAVIPTAFVVALLIGHLVAVPARISLGGASIVGALALVDALFFNPPRTGGAEGSEPAD